MLRFISEIEEYVNSPATPTQDENMTEDQTVWQQASNVPVYEVCLFLSSMHMYEIKPIELIY